MSTCQDCELAAAGVWGGFTHACPVCRARMIARSREHHQARAAGRQTPEYRRMLELAGVTHEAVKEAAQKDLKG